MRALVTGGAGFLGSHLCDYLLAHHWDVVCTDNEVTGTGSNISHVLSHPRFEYLRADVSRDLRCPGRLEYVLHFASPASPPDYLRLPIETLQVGSFGTYNALRLAEHKKSKFLMASTSECYGGPGSQSAARDVLGTRQPGGAAQRL
jgi:dTDP-glucose 4,6-dehydratase